VLVDMESSGRAGHRFRGIVPELHLTADGSHPNDEGYVVMAAAFRQGSEEAEAAGFITAPH